MQPQDDEEYYQVRSTHAVNACLDVLLQPGGASLQLDRPDISHTSSSDPVILMAVEPGGWLQLDLTPSPHLHGALESGAAFFLVGQGGGKLMRSPSLTASDLRQVPGGRVECFCPYPEYFDIVQRRDTFRAELRLGMEAMATASREDQSCSGQLKNLSMTGCLVEFPLSAAAMLSAMSEGGAVGARSAGEPTVAPSPSPADKVNGRPADREGGLGQRAPAGRGPAFIVELNFPNGTRFAINAYLRHQMANMDERQIRAGFEFVDTNTQQDRDLWQFVREIERESARFVSSEANNLVASSLFTRRPGSAGPTVAAEARPELSAVAGRSVSDYPTAMARRLVPVAEFLDVQILALRSGGNVEPGQLSRAAERVLALHEENREELLFALACQRQEPNVVGHLLAVAVRLLDLGKMASLPRDMAKAIVACGLVHDMGKALLPPELLRSPLLDARQRRQLQSHVTLLQPRLVECRWLSESVVRQIVHQVNERVDGSGYPGALRGNELNELSRLAAVVDAIDAMGRPRADREAMTIDRIYRTIDKEAHRFDERWIRRYRQRFGEYPVGTLARFGTGQLGWVRSLDSGGKPAQVQLSDDAVPPSEQSLGKLLSGDELSSLGALVEVVMPR